jgi:hypothetical protein
MQPNGQVSPGRRLAGTTFPRRRRLWAILALKKAPIKASQVQAMLNEALRAA